MKSLIFCFLICFTCNVKCNFWQDVLIKDMKLTIVQSQNKTQELRFSNDPPPVDDAARMARYIVHRSEWASVSHISQQPKTMGYPMARVFSVSDGPVEGSTGIPYIYTTLKDEGSKDLQKNSKCSMTMTLEQEGYCSAKGLDPEDPRCPQVILSGNFIFIKNNTRDWNLAQDALFSRHPVMKKWPLSHHFTFGMLDVKEILLVDNIGGNKYPSVTDYFNSPPEQPRKTISTLFNSVYRVNIV